MVKPARPPSSSARRPALAPLDTAKRSDQAADQLEAAILAGDFPIGEQLPAERELAERLGIGRPAVREAIRVIEHRGLVTVRHGVGTTVTGVTSRPVRETCARALPQGADRARHLLEARLALEVETAALAARRARASDLKAMEAALAAFDAATTREEQARHDLAFHLALGLASGNPLLPLLLEPLDDLLHADRIAGLHHLTAAAAATQHRRIVAAIRAKDPQAASAAMRDHLTAVGAACGIAR